MLFSNKLNNAQSSVLEAILKGTSSRMMAVDNDLNIIYINEAVKEFLLEVEADIKKQLPNFSVATLVGANIDIFHKNPPHQRGMLAKLDKPYLTSISISGKVFNLRAFPLFDGKNTRIGSAVEWLDPSVMDNAGQVAALFGVAIATMIPAAQFSGLLQPVSTLEGAARWIGTFYPTTYFLKTSIGAFTKGLDLLSLQPFLFSLFLFIPALLLFNVLLLRKQEP